MPKILMIICVLLTLAACDTKKDERLAKQRQLTEKISSLAEIDGKITRVQARQSELQSEFDSIKNLLEEDSKAKKESQLALEAYVLEHKAAVAAVAATAAGVAGVLDENATEETKGALGTVGVLGVAYCFFSDDSCTDAAAKVSYYGAQISKYDQALKAKTAQREGIKQRYQLMEQEKAPLLVQKQVMSDEVSALTLQIEALACKRIFCL